MILVNCAVGENSPTQAVLDTGADANYVSQKYISELGITYRSDIVTPDASYSTLGNVNLHIGFNDSEKHKNISGEFVVLGPDWPGPDLILGMPNGATLDVCNSKLLLDDGFAIPFKKEFC